MGLQWVYRRFWESTGIHNRDFCEVFWVKNLPRSPIGTQGFCGFLGVSFAQWDILLENQCNETNSSDFILFERLDISDSLKWKLYDIYYFADTRYTGWEFEEFLIQHGYCKIDQWEDFEKILFFKVVSHIFIHETVPLHSLINRLSKLRLFLR